MSQTVKKKGLSPFDFFTIGFGAIVGVGWAVSINNWMANAGGPVPAALGYILALIVMVPIALAYAELTPMLPVAGGGVAFAYKAFGEKAAFISGWAAIASFATICPWEAIYVTEILSKLFPGLRSGDPVYTLMNTDIYLSGIILGLVLTAILFVVNWRGTKSSAGFQRVMCVLLLGAGVIAIVASLIKGDVSHLQPIYGNVGQGTHGSLMGGAVAIMASAPFFLAGFETIPQGIEDSDGNAKAVGKTVVLTVVCACIFYAVLLFSLGMGIPWQQFYGLDAPAASNLMRVLYGGGVGTVLWAVILLGALCGLLTTWNGFMMATPRLMMSLGRARLLPAAFAKVHPKHGTPYVGLAVMAVFSAVGPFLGLGMIDPLTSFSAAGFVLTWFISILALIRMRKTEPDLPRPYKIAGGMPMAWFGCIVTAVIFVLFFVPKAPCFIGKQAAILFGVWMAVGIVVYLLTIPGRRSVPEAIRTANLFAKLGSEDETEAIGKKAA